MKNSFLFCAVMKDLNVVFHLLSRRIFLFPFRKVIIFPPSNLIKLYCMFSLAFMDFPIFFLLVFSEMCFHFMLCCDERWKFFLARRLHWLHIWKYWKLRKFAARKFFFVIKKVKGNSGDGGNKTLSETRKANYRGKLSTRKRSFH